MQVGAKAISRAVAMEPLEGRVVLSSTLSGTLFEDDDIDARRDSYDIPIAGGTVFLDRNQNGLIDAGEDSVVTDAEGKFHFEDVAPGQIRIRALNGDGWSEMESGRDIEVLSDQSNT